MKLITALLFVSIYTSGCKKQASQINFESYYFKARVVQTSDVSCYSPLLDLSDDSMAIPMMTGPTGLLYTAVSLPQSLNVQNQKLYVLVRTLKPEEEFPCNTLGIMYPRLKILQAKER